MSFKWLKIIASVFILGLCLVTPVKAVEKIDDFQAVIKINYDASINIQETIYYDFGPTLRHGIFREIPVHYKARGGNYNLKIDSIRVSDENGQNYQFSSSYGAGKIKIKIGDPNQLINGIKIYIISYQVNRAINYFTDHDELYWNVTGNDWTVPIITASATVYLPAYVDFKKIQSECFYGALYEAKHCLIELNDDGSLAYKSSLGALSEGLTIVAGWPKGLVYQPTRWENFSNKINDNKIVFLPILGVIGLFLAWWRWGKDARGRGTIVTQFDAPDNLTPLEVGTVVDSRVNNRDITAEIISLAIRGYLKIIREEKKNLFGVSAEYSLEKLKNVDDNLADFDRKLINGFFDLDQKVIKIKSLKGDFAAHLSNVKALAYQSVTSKGYFYKNPQTTRMLFITLSIFVTVFLFFTLVRDSLSLWSVLIFQASAFIFAILMPKMTTQGALAKEHILGLKNYLVVAEKARLDFHNAPDKNPELFEKLLPYAMVLKVEEKWAKQFEDIYRQEPKWSSGFYGANFNSLILLNSLNDFRHSAYANMAPRSSASGGSSGFGGGGFSGGGFGGGGGGSW